MKRKHSRLTLLTWPGFRGPKKDGLHCHQDEHGNIIITCNLARSREFYKWAQADGYPNPLKWMLKVLLPRGLAIVKAKKEVAA